MFGASSDSKTNICQWYADPNDIAEQWEIFDAGNGYVYIRSALGTYMDVQNASTKDGTNVWAYKFNGSTAQRFRLVAIDTEVYDLDIQSLDTIFITPGSSSSFEFTFKGSGIFKSSVSTSSRNGLSGKLNTQWNRYPNRCHTTVTLSASDGFESGTLTVKLLHKNGGILYSKEIKVLPLPASVSAVKDMKNTLTHNASEYKNILNDCLTVSTEILSSKEVLRSLGLTAGSISSGFVTAGWSVLTDTDLLCSIAQLEVARYAVNKAIASANTVLSYENISNKRSAIEFMQAYRDCAAWFHASTQLLQPILDEYAQHADKSTAEQISILSQYFIEGAFDGLLSGLDNIDRTADLLMKYRDQAGNINSFVETALPLFPAYTSYQSAYAMWTHTIQQINNL